MGYNFTMYPRNNQACIKEKHFKLLLSLALAKWAWLQCNLVPWPSVLYVPAAGRRSLHSHPTISLLPQGTVPLGMLSQWGLMQLLWPQPQFALPSQRKGATQSLSFPCALFLPLHPTLSRFLVLINGNHNLKDTKIVNRYFSFSF